MHFKITCFLFFLSAVLFSQNLKRKGSLGVGLYNSIPDSISRSLKLKSKTGSLVKFIVPKSTAEALGIKVNDLIISLNKTQINSTPQLIQSAGQFRDGDAISTTLIRKGKQMTLTGHVIGKPYEKSDVADITYGEFKYEKGFIRTIYKKPKNTKVLGTVYFVHGISCYTLDNLQANDPTKLAIDAMVSKGFAVYCVEKSGVGDSYNTTPCHEIGYNTELDIFKEGYRNLLKLKDVDTSQIFVFGHSLGGISAPILAQEFHPKGVVVYGTGLKPWSEYLLDALLIQPLLYGADLASLIDTIESVKPTFFEYFYNHKPIEELVKTPHHLEALKIGLGYDVNTKLAFAGRTPQFHKELNDHNLANAWKNTDSYVLAIYGEADIAANNSLDHEAIISYVNQYHPDKGTFMLMPKTNHTFQEIGTMSEFIAMQSDQAKYQQYASQHFNTKLFDIVCEWMTDKLNKKL